MVFDLMACLWCMAQRRCDNTRLVFSLFCYLQFNHMTVQALGCSDVEHLFIEEDSTLTYNVSYIITRHMLTTLWGEPEAVRTVSVHCIT